MLLTSLAFDPARGTGGALCQVPAHGAGDRESPRVQHCGLRLPLLLAAAARHTHRAALRTEQPALAVPPCVRAGQTAMPEN
eukprot:6045349-Prymnesium_polylepis.1